LLLRCQKKEKKASAVEKEKLKKDGRSDSQTIHKPLKK
jgi:hypothetical protein